MKNHFLFLSQFLVVISFFTSQAFANNPSSAIANATGGAGVATVEVGEASFMNPASLTHAKGRALYTSFQHDLYAISLTQNDKESAVPGAFSYYSFEKNQHFALSLSDFVYKNIALGVSITYLQAELGLQKKRKSTINANAGLIWTLSQNFGIGFAAENMLTPPDDFQQLGLIEPTSRIGFNYIFKDWFRWRLDFVTLANNRWDKWIPQTGVESYLSKYFIFRVGVSQIPDLEESWSAGFGFDLPRFKLDYASQWHANGGKDQRHSVDLTIPF